MKQDLNDMAVFVEIVKQGSFTHAAETLTLPKSNLSRRMNRLETRLGVRLLERTTRQLNVTEIGQIYFNYCERMIEEANQADLCVDNMLATPKGDLKISASVSTAQYLLSPYLSEFLELNPDVKLQLVCSNRQVDIIEEGFDVAIRIGKLTNSSLIQKKLGSSQHKLFASQNYLNNMGVPLSLSQLSKHRILAMSSANEKTITWKLQKGGQKLSIKIEPHSKINDYTSLYHMVAASAGIAALPDYIAKLHSTSPLVEVLADYQFTPVSFHALYPSHRGTTPKLRAFLDFIGEKFLSEK